LELQEAQKLKEIIVIKDNPQVKLKLDVGFKDGKLYQKV
jgi:hypothetical protein